MDIFTAIIYIILFIVLMIFVFSMGLLTPIIGKRDIISVIAIGFIVGLVGGVFFMTPVYHEIPYVVGTFHETFYGEKERINIEVSPIVDLNKFLTKLNKTDGVVSIINKGVLIKTDPFSSERKRIIEERIPIVDKNFTNFKVNESGFISLNFTEGHDPHHAINTLGDWLMYTGEINIRYSLIHIQIIIEPSHEEEIVKFLNSENIVVTSVEGPSQSAIEDTKNSMLNDNTVLVIFGFVGVIVALISIFIDDIRPAINKFISRIRKKE